MDNLLSSRLKTDGCRLGKLCSVVDLLFYPQYFTESKLYSLVYFFVFSLFYKMMMDEMREMTCEENYATKTYNGTEFK